MGIGDQNLMSGKDMALDGIFGFPIVEGTQGPALTSKLFSIYQASMIRWIQFGLFVYRK